MDHHHTYQTADAGVGAAAEYYNSTTPIPVPGATAITPPPPASAPHPDFGGPGQQQPGRTSQNHHTTSAGAGYLPSAPVGIKPPPPQQHYYDHQHQQQQQHHQEPPLVHSSPQFVTPGEMLLTHHTPVPTTTPRDLGAVRAGAEFAVKEYASLQRRRRDGDVEVGPALEEQSGVVAMELGRLRAHVKEMAVLARQHRWRRWLIGGFVGTLIPAVRRLFRRPESNSEGTSNDTEYAFFHSKSLVQRVLDSVRGGWSGISRLASATFLVFAVLYVFQNEVTLRVASTLSKRLKRLSSKIENSDNYEMSDKDLALLRGWRWRVLSRS
ncbi:hypothetical protein MCOR27_005929 [Pyricularia oryzae]|uniref:Uncharacterized protein n=1 Tax=Pyricularia grisea TaxID=148305 RepID=A0ABQ8N5H9_PYRGI|nr:hypothetical protein MCOR01_003702 [Pyricularia oryzae]KAI6291616.1 hypothetical protein MCOR33_010470 [Pyricularia grisea]KAI6262378.1 hypothetical protein MCOR19_001417 [Pyricularia oryzae]KAI6277811.1 hypothetical protein MCOR27_005929 [Pyricularia oryzae]KAI6305524.1 hypothetical protein MCOR29_010436 [Pyricularia oryzae]